jgi:hypothetical protein
MIHKEGGFLREEDSEIVPLDDGKKISKFKAARLGRG